MGQAAAVLPDPLEQPTLDNTASADDLLSQMAGDEIDRLLSEAEVERPPAAGTPPESSPISHDSSKPTPEDIDLGEIVQAEVPAIKEKQQKASASASAAAENLDATLSTQLDDLFRELNAEAPSQVAEAPPAQNRNVSVDAENAENVRNTEATMEQDVSVSLPPAPSTVNEPPAATAVANPDEAMAAAERQALTADISAEIVESVATDPPAPMAEKDHTASLLIRVLQWINAPLAGCDEGVRDAVGKVAIMTLLNALALLIYVLVFRR